jgi:methylmalonyl-CoA mutase C-terminal domain/subunit
MALIRERGLDHVLVVLGGIIPDADIPTLEAMGIAEIFLPGSPMQDIVQFITQHVRPHADVL